MMTSSKRYVAFQKTEMCKKIFIVFVTLSDLNKTSKSAAFHTYEMHDNGSVLL